MIGCDRMFSNQVVVPKKCAVCGDYSVPSNLVGVPSCVSKRLDQPYSAVFTLNHDHIFPITIAKLVRHVTSILALFLCGGDIDGSSPTVRSCQRRFGIIRGNAMNILAQPRQAILTNAHHAMIVGSTKSFSL